MTGGRDSPTLRFAFGDDWQHSLNALDVGCIGELRSLDLFDVCVTIGFSLLRRKTCEDGLGFNEFVFRRAAT
jgi:hypothetical protein